MAQTTFKSVVTTGVILIIACFGVGYFLTTPQWSKYSLAKDQLAVLQTENQKLTEALASLQSFLDDYKDHQKDASTVSLALPVNNEDLANFAASVGDLAKSSGVVLSNVSIVASPSSKSIADNSIEIIPINLTASGSFASFKDFMIRMQNHLRIVDVGHVTLRADDNNILQYQISLKTYYQK